jgi:hypothetical protein
VLRSLALFLGLILVPVMADAQPTGPAPGSTVGTDDGSSNRSDTESGPGWKIIQFGEGHGYLRYQADPEEENRDDGTPVTQGTFSVVSEHAPVGAPAVRPAEPKDADIGPPPEEAPPVGEAPPMAKDRCQANEDALAQRLLHLRGIEVDPVTASLVLPQLELPVSPYVVRAMYGQTTQYLGGSLLASAISYDLDTQLLSAQLAQCLRE